METVESHVPDDQSGWPDVLDEVAEEDRIVDPHQEESSQDLKSRSIIPNAVRELWRRQPDGGESSGTPAASRFLTIFIATMTVIAMVTGALGSRVVLGLGWAPSVSLALLFSWVIGLFEWWLLCWRTPPVVGQLSRMSVSTGRWLVLALLVQLLGTALSCVINSSALEKGRQQLAVSRALEAQRQAAEMEFKAATQNHERALEQAKVDNSRRQDRISALAAAVEAAELDLSRAQQDYETAAAQVTCERSSECSGYAGGPGLERAIAHRQQCLETLQEAQAGLVRRQDALERFETDAPPVPLPLAPALKQVGIEDLNPAERSTASTKGLADSIMALHLVAHTNGWPLAVRWAPELLILLVHVPPALVAGVRSGLRKRAHDGEEAQCIGGDS